MTWFALTPYSFILHIECLLPPFLPIQLHSNFLQYFKMMKMGLPKEAAKHAMARDQLDGRYVLRVIILEGVRLNTLTPNHSLFAAFWIWIQTRV